MEEVYGGSLYAELNLVCDLPYMRTVLACLPELI